jgi:hypothetical protein
VSVAIPAIFPVVETCAETALQNIKVARTANAKRRNHDCARPGMRDINPPGDSSGAKAKVREIWILYPIHRACQDGNLHRNKSNFNRREEEQPKPSAEVSRVPRPGLTADPLEETNGDI